MEKQYQQKQHDIFLSIKNIVNTFSSISLKEMDGIALLNRTDTKFVFHKMDLIPVLEEMKNHYKVLEIDKGRVMTYNSLYFDTKTKIFYHDHHNGKINRKKIRIRKYLESNRCFLEIKQKDAKGKTNKSRIEIPDIESFLSEASIDFIRKITLKDYDLSPTIWSLFNRITMVNNTDKERVTIDLNLSFNINDSTESFDNIVILLNRLHIVGDKS